jgi:hypothetical protein
MSNRSGCVSVRTLSIRQLVDCQMNPAGYENHPTYRFFIVVVEIVKTVEIVEVVETANT